MNIPEVLTLIRPGAEWVCRGSELEWLDKVQSQPTAEELEAGWDQLQTLAYRAARAKEYPSVGDQLDAMWKGGQAAADMLARIQAVKTKYPK